MECQRHRTLRAAGVETNRPDIALIKVPDKKRNLTQPDRQTGKKRIAGVSCSNGLINDEIRF
jgi:hypothetical protein